MKKVLTLCTPSLLLGVNVFGFFWDSMKACILENVGIFESLKKALVEPDSKQPYLILVCLARSSADSMGDSILSTVRKAARLAVYEEVTTRMNSHHIVAMMRVDTDLMAWQCETFSQNGLILWDNVRTLLHKRADSKPHCVQQRELVDQNL